MSVLRVYDPPECDEHGVPLHWERCRVCDGRGYPLPWVGVQFVDEPPMRPPACTGCGGHGSLKAAAFAHLDFMQVARFPGAGPYVPRPGSFRVRCEDCGHPASDGRWEGYPATHVEEWAVPILRAGGEPHPDDGPIHFSFCDEGCRHGGPVRGQYVPDGPWSVAQNVDLPRYLAHAVAVEALWRMVDVRTLGWPHDLRQEQLALLCLRCWAAR